MSQMYIFGYGSLVTYRGMEHIQPAELHGYQRVWNVATDNTVDIPNHRHFIDPVTRQRPALFITWLNIVEAANSKVNGVLIPVDAVELSALDWREQNYTRIDVTKQIFPAPPGGQVYTYFGTKEGMDRFAAGVRTNSAVIVKSYMAAVLDGFANLNNAAYTNFMESTIEPKLPILSLNYDQAIANV